MEVSFHRQDEQTRTCACLRQWHTNTRPCKQDPTARSPARLVALAVRLLRRRPPCMERRRQTPAFVLHARKCFGNRRLVRTSPPTKFRESRVGLGAIDLG